MNDLDNYELAWGIGAGLLSIASLIHLFTGEGLEEVILCQGFAWGLLAIMEITLYIWKHPKKKKPVDGE